MFVRLTAGLGLALDSEGSLNFFNSMSFSIILNNVVPSCSVNLNVRAQNVATNVRRLRDAIFGPDVIECYLCKGT